MLGLGIKNKGQGWTPRALGSILAAWYRADQGVSLTGSIVTRWADLSGNGQDAVQKSPGTGCGYIPGPPGSAQMVFGAIDQELNNNLNLTSMPYEIILVASTTSSGVLGRPLASTLPEFYVSAPATMAIQTVTPVVATFQNNGTPQVFDGVFNGTSSSLSVNGGTPVTGDTGTGFGTGGWYIGNRAEVNPWPGSIYEVIFLSGQTTGPQQTALQNYFQTLYGTP